MGPAAREGIDDEDDDVKKDSLSKNENGLLDRGEQQICREQVLFVALPNCASVRNPLATYPDCVAAVDVDPESDSFCKVISLLEVPNEGDELHHFGLHSDPTSSSTASTSQRLIFPTRSSGRIYVVNASDPHELRLEKTIDSETLTSMGISYPNRVHYMPDSPLMISTMGDDRLDNAGNFLLLDQHTLEPHGLWAAAEEAAKFGGDFWPQPEHNVMLSTGWGSPAKFRHGFWPSDVANGHYSKELYVWEWRQPRRLLQTITLDDEGDTGWMPLAVRFVHNSRKCHAFVCTLLGSAIYHLWRKDNEDDNQFKHRLAASMPPKKVEGWQCPSFVPQFIQDLLVSMNWALPKMPAFTTDMVISMDDRYLFVSNWLHGDVRQYDIIDPFNIQMVAQCFTGGSIRKGCGVEVVEDEELNEMPEGVVWEDGSRLEGGPQMLQLSVDGRRLYVTNSFYLPWDAQFYPELSKSGSTILQLDVDTEKGGLSVNKSFKVHFGHSGVLPKGPYAAREMHFAGGDCTSPNWR